MLKFLIVIAMTGLTLVSACGDAAPPVSVSPSPSPTKAKVADSHDHEGEDDVPRISLADAKKEYDAGNAVIIDVRDESAYKQEHIKGSLNIPVAQIDANVDKIPKGKKVIAYCS